MSSPNRLRRYGEELTGREKEVLRLYAAGLQSPEIGAAIGIGYETVKSHRRRVMAKLGANTVTEAVAISLKRNLI